MQRIATDNWEMTKKRFDAWWAGTCIDRPLLRVVAKLPQPNEPLESIPPTKEPADLYLNVDRLLVQMRNHLRTHRFMAEAYPNLSVDLGAGSMALYQGSEPIFAEDTIWFRECLEGEGFHFDGAIDPQNFWFLRHIEMLKQAAAAADGAFFINMPDIVENMDILSNLRGPQQLCYDMIDEPEKIEEAVHKVDALYFTYYDRFRELIVLPDDRMSFTAFHVMGRGRTAKVQCDFCALMSPRQFRRFVQPSLRAQCRRLDHSVYHLDGPDAIKHLDALMEIDELQALQWTCGAGQPDSGSPRWYPIYDRVREAKKSLHLSLFEGVYEDWIRQCDTLVQRYGVDGIYFLLPEMSLDEAERFIDYADAHWKKL